MTHRPPHRLRCRFLDLLWFCNDNTVVLNPLNATCSSKVKYWNCIIQLGHQNVMHSGQKIFTTKSFKCPDTDFIGSRWATSHCSTLWLNTWQARQMIFNHMLATGDKNCIYLSPGWTRIEVGNTIVTFVTLCIFRLGLLAKTTEFRV